MPEEDLVYAHGRLSIMELEEEISLFWNELETNPQIRSEVTDAGLSLEALTTVGKEQPITVRADSSGADPDSVLLIVSLAPTANSILKDVWRTVLLPRIRERWGQDAVGHEEKARENKRK